MGHAIEVHGVSKQFKVSLDRHDSIKERVLKLGRKKQGHEEFWALRDIDFAIEAGETVALLGHNGSGKSTLLKCIGGIIRPTTGEIRTRGRVASLLELGAGFHPDLTGRENVFLNASILGLSRKDIEARFDDIVGFAELEPFIDNQVKHYSSGMYIRLGFAVAINVEPDILLIDEVLAVGDELFQQKCLSRIRDFQDEGRTIVVVSHAVDLVRQISDHIVVLDHGKQITYDEPTEAVRVFRRYLHGTVTESGEVIPDETEGHSERARIRDVEVSGATGEHFSPTDRVEISFTCEIDEPLEDVVASLQIVDVSGAVVYGTNSEIIEGGHWALERSNKVRFVLNQLPLLDGHYRITLGLHDHQVREIYDQSEFVSSFEVVGTPRVVGIADLRATVSRD